MPRTPSIRPVFGFFSWLVVAWMAAGFALAQPALTVTNVGANADGNLQWRVDVQPDSSLFTDGEGAIAAEVGFVLSGSVFLDAMVNEAVWAFPLPGFNAFTNTITTGLLQADTETFVSFGSDPVTGPVELLTLTTQGASATTLRWGGQAIRPGQSGSFEGARLAQAGLKFDGISGSLDAGAGLVGDCNMDGSVDAGDLACACGAGVLDSVLSATGLLRGDLDGDGNAQFADFLTLSANFGKSELGYTDGDVNCNGSVEFGDFLVLSSNFGKSSAATLAIVPEPTCYWLPVLVALLTHLVRRTR